MSTGTLDAPDGDGEWIFRECEGVLWRLTHVKDGKATAGWIYSPSGQGMALEKLKGEWRRPLEDEVRVARGNHTGQVLQWVLWRHYSFCAANDKRPKVTLGYDGEFRFEWFDEVRRHHETDEVKVENRLPTIVFELISMGSFGGYWTFRSEAEAMTVADCAAFQAICRGSLKPRGYI